MNALLKLEQWYLDVCDGEWEHSHGITIETLDNPGWFVRIDIRETSLEEKSFSPIAVESADGKWMDIRIKEGFWQAACHPTGLSETLAIFTEWVKRQARPGEPT